MVVEVAGSAIEVAGRVAGRVPYDGIAR